MVKIGHDAAKELNQWLIGEMENTRGLYTSTPRGEAWMEALHQLAREKIPGAPPVRKGFSRKYAVEAVTWGVDSDHIKAAYLLIYG